MNERDAERPGMAIKAQPETWTGRTARAFASLLALCAVFLVGTTGQTRADFRVCNATQNLVGVAIGYRVKTGWTTEGWWHVDPSSCKTLIEGPLSSRFYYIYAEDAERGGRWEGPINMCVAEKEFKIAGLNDCFARGFQRAGFQEYDTGEQSSWMVQLTDETGQAAQDGATPALGSGINQSEGEADTPPDQPAQPAQNP